MTLSLRAFPLSLALRPQAPSATLTPVSPEASPPPLPVGQGRTADSAVHAAAKPWCHLLAVWPPEAALPAAAPVRLPQTHTHFHDALLGWGLKKSDEASRSTIKKKKKNVKKQKPKKEQ